MMNECPTCGRDSLINVEGTAHFKCEACDVGFSHEGNAFIEEIQ